MTTSERLADLLLRWEELHELGENVTAAQLCPDQPDLVEPLQQQIDRLQQMAWMTKEADDEPSIAPDPRIGTLLSSRYRLDAVVGEGGFGRVYRGFDLELQRLVAIKVTRSERLGQIGGGLVEEARRAAQLRHPGIVAVHDVGRDDGNVFIVSDFIEGINLAEVIATARPSPRDVARLVADIADALYLAHEQNFIHRDIKPANVLLDQQGRPLIADFGLAADTEQVARGVDATSGTFRYMAPEQLAGETQLIGPRTDIYALGVVLYELLTGRLPFGGRTPTALREQTLFRQPVPPRSVNTAVPEFLEAICLRCLAKHPTDRFASAAALSEALRNTPARTSPKLPTKWLGLMVLGLLIFGVGVLVGTMNTKPNNSAENRTDELAPEHDVFVFDGKSRIVTSLEPIFPCTLEAWVWRLDHTWSVGEKREQFVIGSDVPNFYGIGLALYEAYPCVETIRGGFHIEKAVPLKLWTHIAAVFATEETTIYLNGKKIGVGPASQPPTRKTQFVIGNVGLDHANLYFRGKVRSVRISKGERYKGDFVPDESFGKDADDAPAKAVLIYDGSAVEGDRVIDLSGAGNDGRWEQLKP